MTTPTSSKRELSPTTKMDDPGEKRGRTVTTSLEFNLFGLPSQSTPNKVTLEPSIGSIALDESTIKDAESSLESCNQSEPRLNGNFLAKDEEFKQNLMIALQDDNVATVLNGLIKSTVAHYESRIQALEEKVAEQDAIIRELKPPEQMQSADPPQSMAIPEQTDNKENNLVFRGIAEGLNDIRVITRLVNEELDVPMAPSQIVSTSRMGRNNPENCRPLLVKLANKNLRDSIYNERIVLRPKLPYVFIQEDLTREQARLAYAARLRVRKRMIFRTWTTNGTVFIVRNEGEEATSIASEDDLPRITNADENIDQNQG